MAWSWHFTPTRIYSDRRFLRLSKVDEAAAGLLLRLYHACDRWGRGPHDDLALGVRTGLVAADDLLERMERLYATGMVLQSADGSAWELERYDEDAPRDVKRDRSPSEYPQGQQNGPREKSGNDPGGARKESGDSPEASRKESAHARACAAARALPPGRETRQGKEEQAEGAAPQGPAPHEPTPAASTDARAIGSPVPVAPSPSALGGAAVGAPMGDPPSPRPEGPMTRRLREEAEQKRAAERKEAEVRALALAALEASRRAPDKPLDDPEALRRAAAEKLADGRLALPPPVQSDEPDEDDWDHVQALVAARSFVVVGEEAPCLPD